MKRPYLDEMHDEIDRLRAQNAALVKALQEVINNRADPLDVEIARQALKANA